MDDLITVIVPVYNGEKYIKKCLDSILKQTYKSLEILIVNDGSTDKTGEIVQEYIKKYSNIKVVTKENAGLPQARATGVKNADGQYIGFVDVDDWIEPDMYEILHKLCIEKEAQVSACGLIFEYGSKGVAQSDPNGKDCVYDNVEALLQLNKRSDIKTYAWNKLYYKDVFEGIEFEHGNFIGEDYDIVTKILCKKIKVAWTPKCLYHYWQATGTMCHSSFSKMHRLSYEILLKRCGELTNQYPEHREVFENYILTEFIMYVIAMARGKNYDETILNAVKKHAKQWRKQYCSAEYIGLKFKCSIIAFCINYHLFVWGYMAMEKVRSRMLR